LNPIEEAAAYSKLITEIELSQEEVAEKVGKDRSTVTNLLRLLRLPEPIRDAIARQKLSPGHARPLLSLRDSKLQVQIAKEVAEKGLSVREVERRVQALAAAPKAKKAAKATPPVDANTRAAEDRLRQALGTRVRILRKGRRGTIEIAFYSEEELGGIYEVLLRGARSKFHRVK
jgi:ParB family chromosome partitioning protein